MPRLWNETIETHRESVRAAILEATGALVAEHGLMAVTMKEIAARTGIGRATLYGYFPDVQAVLLAWHERHVAAHLARLTELHDQAGEPWQRLEAVLAAYAMICHHRPPVGTELAAFLHRPAHVAGARQHLAQLVRNLLAEVAATGRIRADVAPDELASYCLHALGAAGSLPSAAAVHRLVTVTLSGLRPSPGP